MRTGTLTLIETCPAVHGDRHPFAAGPPGASVRATRVRFDAEPEVGARFRVVDDDGRTVTTTTVRGVRREGDRIYFRTRHSAYALALDPWPC